MSDPKYEQIGEVSDRVTEECAELIQAISKANRFGLFNCHPTTKISNIQLIECELKDVLKVIEEYKDYLNNQKFEL